MRKLLERLKHLRLYSSALFLDQDSARCSSGLVISRSESVEASIELTRLLAEKVDVVVGALEQVEALKATLTRILTEDAAEYDTFKTQLAQEVERRKVLDHHLKSLIWYDSEANVWVGKFGGVLSQGTTIDEAIAATHDAVQLMISSTRDRHLVEVERRELLESLIDEDHGGHRKTCACPLCTGYEAYIERYKEKR